MMKIDKAPVPLILPNPQDPRLTERVAGTDQTGATVEIKVPVERRRQDDAAGAHHPAFS